MADDTDNTATPDEDAPATAAEPAPAEGAAQPAVGAEEPAAPPAEAQAPAADPVAEESAPAAEAARPVREVTGVVTSSKPHKTIIVRVDRRVQHPVYGKFIRRSTKLAAHDEANACAEGDTVTIRQTRPISKTKCWVLGSIVSRAGA